ncbi:YbjN domain-containing protein [Lapillicoccus jejuensis]|uniref:Putative sensory transduction regulator n=1 Tax=Lapillicoccus jejuensis TaxID=402171 RepID=A0A542E0J2_9MICO|nr:YbjN domain-containing protein [Lapillicoccus jejuensis]TQJ08863.1 putative sensory transduction regulator [Lapillicoccus jejuensis]
MTTSETTAPPTDDEAVAAAAETVLRDWLGENDLEWELGGRRGEYVVTLPGEKKLKTVVSVVIKPRQTSVSAFVIRHPDENEGEFYKALLRRNLRMPSLAYAVDASGDVYVKGEVPTAGVDAETVDRLLGVALDAADSPFDDLLVIGFLSSMRKEWAWRVSRGESLRNLEAFRPLLERAGDPPPAD